MRLGLMGDIHGNADALEAVLRSARDNDVEALCITGDLLGYYYEPARVLDLLDPWPHWIVRGNHEDMLGRLRTDPAAAAAYSGRYGSGGVRALGDLEPDRLARIETLPRTLMIEFPPHRLLLAHGSPWDTDEYVYPDAPMAILERMAECGADFVVLGHTHHQTDWRIEGCRIINPGSVGQPRDRRPGAAWSLLDTRSGHLMHRRETYDISNVVSAAMRYDPTLEYNWNVLART